jgi:hypothetical protein
MTDTFESQHPRESTGKFDTKDQSAPEVALDTAAEALATAKYRAGVLADLGIPRGRFAERKLDDAEFEELKEHLAGSIEIWAPYDENAPSSRITVSYPEFYSSDGIYNIARVLNREKTGTSWTIHHTGNIYSIPDVVAKAINFNDMTHDRVRTAEQRLADYALYGSAAEGLPAELADERVALEKSRAAAREVEDAYQVNVLSNLTAYADENWPENDFDKAVFKCTADFVDTAPVFEGFERDGQLVYTADDTDEATTYINRLAAELADPHHGRQHLNYAEDDDNRDDKYSIDLVDYR